jgi:uncharacterized repeat protein (TIGR03843 family)
VPTDPLREGSPRSEGGLDEAGVEDVLTNGSLELEGRLVLASNASFLGRVSLEGVSVDCVYKPVSGERPLWDFPEGTLAARERAARVVSEAGGWHVVPPTILRDGRFGTGMVQQWIDIDPDEVLVDVVGTGFDDQAWIAVLEAEDHAGRPVLLAHADDERLRDLALMDVVINNADRKGGHVLPDCAGRVWGCDHGVTFHRDSKLRTVLWGWAAEPLRVRDVDALLRLQSCLDGATGKELRTLLSTGELAALRRRITRLLETGEMPSPRGSWPAIPWPAI